MKACGVTMNVTASENLILRGPVLRTVSESDRLSLGSTGRFS
jgi:hypothetical protein